MTMSKLTPHTGRKRTVIKLGGSMLEGLDEAFFLEMIEQQQAGEEFIIVHGGGPAINKALAAKGVASSVLDGIRVTSKEAIGIVHSALMEEVNPFLVQQLKNAGIHAKGLSGAEQQLLSCTLLDEARYGQVGDIQQVNATLIENLLEKELVPVISCIGADVQGNPLNINADTVASSVALAMQADRLLLVTDTPGIKIDEQVQQTATASQINAWVESGDIYGGMLPKVQAALDCLTEGVPVVSIVGQQLEGTAIMLEEVPV